MSTPSAGSRPGRDENARRNNTKPKEQNHDENNGSDRQGRQKAQKLDAQKLMQEIEKDILEGILENQVP
jgi:hypothetical protein